MCKATMTIQPMWDCVDRNRNTKPSRQYAEELICLSLAEEPVKDKEGKVVQERPTLPAPGSPNLLDLRRHENRPCPKKRNGQRTWGLPRHMGGVRESARCPYGAAEPSWAMVRCYSSSHPPILYTACVGFYNLSHVIY